MGVFGPQKLASTENQVLWCFVLLGEPVVKHLPSHQFTWCENTTSTLHPPVMGSWLYSLHYAIQMRDYSICGFWYLQGPGANLPVDSRCQGTTVSTAHIVSWVILLHLTEVQRGQSVLYISQGVPRSHLQPHLNKIKGCDIQPKPVLSPRSIIHSLCLQGTDEPIIANNKYYHFLTTGIPEFSQSNYSLLLSQQIGASLLAQWLRICLPMQGTQVRGLV